MEKQENGFYLNFENNKVIRFTQDSITFDNFGKEFKQPSSIKNSPKLGFEENNNSFMMYPKPKLRYGDRDFSFSDLSIKATFFLWRPKIHAIGVGIIGLIILSTLITVFFIKKKPIFKFKLLGIIYVPFLVIGTILFISNNQIYLVNQAEIDALDHLESLSYGKVVVVKGGCLICEWQTKYPPPAFANKKDYVSRLSRKPIIYNNKIFQTKSRKEGRQELKSLGAKYIYLVRYKGYLEEMPFSPGDLNVEKIYENANSQIWQVKNI
ncbi:MAG: hypothetical protein M1365_03405 [Actinobacteria bacterium]|nr:hypothetical protein [Actinomycetota bacterium]